MGILLMAFEASFEDLKARQSKNGLQELSLVFYLAFFEELVLRFDSSYQKRMVPCAVVKWQVHSMLWVSKTLNCYRGRFLA